jgi:aldose 1-epimerase
MTTRVDHIITDGFPFLRLRCAEDGSETEALVSPLLGANLCRLTYNGRHIIDFEPDVLARGRYTGAFLLYPFPNRMTGNRYVHNDKTYGHPYSAAPDAYMHGVAFMQAFTVESLRADGGHASVRCKLDVAEGSPVHALFPFAHQFFVTYTLTPGRLRIEFSIQNPGNAPVPFGLGIHPYFTRLGGDAGTRIEVPADTRMVATEELLPTGELKAAEGGYDLRAGRALSELSLDDVFLRAPDKKAVITYEGEAFRTELDAGPSFTHFVVFTPPGKPYFCVEHQTCSTDAFNLSAKGFVKEAHLLEVPAGGVFEDWVEYGIVDHG